jgi:hypothetical protein
MGVNLLNPDLRRGAQWPDLQENDIVLGHWFIPVPIELGLYNIPWPDVACTDLPAIQNNAVSNVNGAAIR